MTKLKLKFVRNEELLSREEMKQVFGGYMSGSDETGSGCYWYRCKCSEPISSMLGSNATMSTYVRGTKEEAKKEAENDCNAFMRVDCVQDIPCRS